MPIRDTLRRPLAPFVGLALLAVLTGCEALALTPAIAVYAGVEGIALNQTGKLASDHAASAITGQDCSFLRYKDTGNYCRSAAEIAAEEAASPATIRPIPPPPTRSKSTNRSGRRRRFAVKLLATRGVSPSRNGPLRRRQ